MEEADNFIQFIRYNCYEKGGKIHWNWVESYDAKVTDAFREILLKILKGGKNDRR